MVRERCHFYRPAGNVERAEIRIGEFVFKHQAPMPVEPNIHASERLDPRAVQLILLVNCAADIRLEVGDRGPRPRKAANDREIFPLCPGSQR